MCTVLYVYLCGEMCTVLYVYLCGEMCVYVGAQGSRIECPGEPRWLSGLWSPMLRTEGRGLESRLCQGLSLAGSRWSDIIDSSLRGRGGRLSNLDSRIRSASDTWSYGRRARGCGLEKAYHSLDR